MTDQSRSAADHDLAALQMRALRRRQRHVRSAQRFAPLTMIVAGYARRLIFHYLTLPTRYALHLLVIVLVPLAIVASQIPPGSPFVDTAIPGTQGANPADFVAPVAPLALDSAAQGERPAPDAAF